MPAVASGKPTEKRAPWGGQNGRFGLTRLAGLPEDGSHDETPVPQRGVQAAGCVQDLRVLLLAHGLVRSISRCGNLYDNAKTVSFMQTV